MLKTAVFYLFLGCVFNVCLIFLYFVNYIIQTYLICCSQILNKINLLNLINNFLFDLKNSKLKNDEKIISDIVGNIYYQTYKSKKKV